MVRFFKGAFYGMCITPRFRKQWMNNHNEKGPSRMDTLMTKDFPLSCATECACALGSPQQNRGDTGSKGSYFLGVDSPSAFFCCLCPLIQHAHD